MLRDYALGKTTRGCFATAENFFAFKTDVLPGHSATAASMAAPSTGQRGQPGSAAASMPSPSHQIPTKAAGFSLLELMITVSVLTVLLMLAVPSFRTLMHNSRVTAVTNDLVLALTVARTEAIKRGQPVRVCASSDGLVCDGTWSDGWIINLPDGGDPIRVWAARSFDIAPNETGGITRVVFDPLGACSTGRATFVIGDGMNQGLRTLSLSLEPSGRTVTEIDTCVDCG